MKAKERKARGKTAPPVEFEIIIDPGSYLGRFYPHGKGELSGISRTKLPVGPVLIELYEKGMHFDLIFNIRPTGDIDPASIRPIGAATAIGRTLRFQTVDLDVDPGKFTGIYKIGGFAKTSGPERFSLVKGLKNFLQIHRTGTNGESIELAVSDLGAISTSNFPGAVTITTKRRSKVARLTFNTRSVVVRGAPGLSGEFWLGSKKVSAKVGDRVDIVVNYPVEIINKNLRWPAPDNSVGVCEAGSIPSPLPLLTFVPAP